MKEQTLQERIVEFVATAIYLGKLPKAPGTWGTFLGIPIALGLAKVGEVPYLIGALVLVAISAISAEMYERQTHQHDPQEIVIDEVVGFVITMTWLPQTWEAYVAGFIAFRFFDIVKPFPISYIDRNVKGGLGTTLDDVAAGVAGSILLQVIYNYTPWLGAQLHV